MLTFKTLSTIIFSGLAAGMAVSSAQAQVPAKADDPQMKIYRATPPKINDLVHTKLDVRFDYKKRYMYGKEWVTLRPHFYPTDSLRLDAKGMDIKNIYEFEHSKEAAEFVPSIIKKNDVILVKGSQGVRMERVVEALLKEPANKKKFLARQDKEWENR